MATSDTRFRILVTDEGDVCAAVRNAGLNIAEYHQARLAQGADALAVISVDGEVSEPVRRVLLALPQVRSATVVNIGND